MARYARATWGGRLLRTQFRDLYIARTVCWEWNAVFGNRDVEKHCLRKRGLPPTLRFRFWSWHSSADALERVGGSLSTYRSSLAKSKFKTDHENASWFVLTQQPGVEGEIARDVRRTFPNRALFRVKNGLGQRMLFNILIALAVHEPRVGYCQGMNFVVAVMISVSLGCDSRIPDAAEDLALASEGLSPEQQESAENKVFWLMVAFLNRFDMRELWRPGVPQLKLRIYQFDRLISSKLPLMHAHFREIGLAPDFFASQWFLTLMSYNMSMTQLLRVWDVLIFDGWKTIFRVGIAVLQRCEKDILGMSLEQLSHFFRHERGSTQSSTGLQDGEKPGSSIYVSDSEMLASAFEVKISTRELADLESDYITHILFRGFANNGEGTGARPRTAPQAIAHQSSQSSHEKPARDQADDLAAAAFGNDDVFVDHRLAAMFREEIDHLDMDTKNDVQYLRAKIEQAERLFQEREASFRKAAQEYMEIKTTRDELQLSKRAVSDQLFELTRDEKSLDQDCEALLDKVEFIDARIRAISDRFRDALWKTSQAQVELEEVVEQKHAFSQQLHAVLDHTEQVKTQAIKNLWSTFSLS
ncbi:TBC1 domain family member 1 [Hondaea fermentalgiana]|uniref:TBC1 domain family member 1 n=1 Tax=Hondaea fermentalgiana TaxID=2315210 RepID=A0A2R5G867_9STRA|nr:TBC1 domain family member 1 [Hondaea fermentalgiana]|eukprot:GBG27237.1 TBC1 domain family member 1 [Hondaea fermentalgiana]